MEIGFNCAHCNERLQLPPTAVDQTVRCPQCGHLQQAGPSTDSSQPQAAILIGPESEQGHNPFREDVLETLAASASDPTTNPYASSSTLSAYGTSFVEQQNLAPRGRRLLGSLIDWIITASALVPGFLCSAWASQNGNNLGLMVTGGMVTILFIAAATGLFWYMAARSGQSPGKQMLGMRVVRMHDRTIPGFLPGVLMRQWLFAFVFFSTFWFCCPIGFLVYIIDGLLIFGERQQCLHDLLASTIVVNVDEPEAITVPTNHGRARVASTAEQKSAMPENDG